MKGKNIRPGLGPGPDQSTRPWPGAQHLPENVSTVIHTCVAVTFVFHLYFKHPTTIIPSKG